MKRKLLIIGGLIVLGGITIAGIRYYSIHTAKWSLNVNVSDWSSNKAQFEVRRNGKTEASGTASPDSGGSGAGNGNYQLSITSEGDKVTFTLMVRGKLSDRKIVDFSRKSISSQLS